MATRATVDKFCEASIVASRTTSSSRMVQRSGSVSVNALVVTQTHSLRCQEWPLSGELVAPLIELAA